MAAPRYLRVAVPSPLYQDFDYLPPPGVDPATLAPGIRLTLPFGRREVTGVLLATAADSRFPLERLKTARRVLDATPLIPADMLALAHWAADYYRHPIGEVMQALLPVVLRQGRPAEQPDTAGWRLSEAGRRADPA